MCNDCGKEPKKVAPSGKVLARCEGCHREYKRLEMARLRRKRKMDKIAANDDPSRRVCTKCLHSKLFSEFSTNRSDGGGRLNKICDTCLTAVYLSPARLSLGFDEVWWRKRAYTCNTTARNMIAKKKGVNVKLIKTADLPYICKPQDLIAIFDAQGGNCHYCPTELTPDNTSVDHATPLCRDGEHHPDNFRIACNDCNHLKWKRTEEEFRIFLRKYVSALHATF